MREKEMEFNKKRKGKKKYGRILKKDNKKNERKMEIMCKKVGKGER